jgi:hypothetical protein
MNFTIEQLDTDADSGVIQAHWRVTKTSGDNTAESYGSCDFFPDSTAEDYIAFDSLTEANVIDWVRNQLDLTDLEEHLDLDLAQQTPSLPW